MESALLLAMVGILAGTVFRTVPGSGWVVAGTVVIGAGITIGNVLLPGIVKQDFPHRQGLVTGLMTAALIGGAAVAAAVAAPLAYAAGLGWRGSLLVLGALAGVAAIAWLPQSRRPHTAAVVRVGHGAVLRSPVTWFLAAFMGTQSLAYYALLAWLPAILGDTGVSPARAGLALALFNLLGIGTAILAPIRRLAAAADRPLRGDSGDGRRVPRRRPGPPHLTGSRRADARTAVEWIWTSAGWKGRRAQCGRMRQARG